MNMTGTIIRETSNAVLFEAEEGTVFGSQQIWWPLKQVTLFRHGGAGYASRNSERLITSRWIAETKASELGLTAELAAHYAHVESLEREEREQKARRRASKADRTPEQIATDAATKQAKEDRRREEGARFVATRKAAAEQAAQRRAAWDAMDEPSRDNVYIEAGLKLGKNAPKWIHESSAFGARFHKALAKQLEAN